MTSTATEFQRLLGRFVLFLAGVWVLVLIAGITGSFRGASIPLMNWAIILVPGCAFVPATYYAVKLQMPKTSGEEVKALWPKAAGYGVAGIALLISAGYSLYRMGQA